MDPIDIVPDTAPFSESQRQWLNGFLSGWLGADAAGSPSSGHGPTPEEDEAMPWHDDTMPIDERMALAETRPVKYRLMAAMGQQDCGQCGYLCKSYAEALAAGSETDATLCVPGGRETRQVVKTLLAEHADEIGASGAAAAPVAPQPGTRAHPVPARIREVSALTGPGSSKDIRHVTLDLSESGLTYRAGDSLGVYVTNDPELVGALLEILGLDGHEFVVSNGEATTTREALFRIKDITRPSDETVALLAEAASEATEAAELTTLAADSLAEGIDLLELLECYPSCRTVEPARLIAALGDLQPRLYSISSSPTAHAGEVHATIAVVRYERTGRARRGVASTFFGERTREGDIVPVYVQPTADFLLPADDASDVIMVGPGTGVAPFRAFLHERRAAGASGRAWLLFGNPNEATDYLYRDEIEGFLEDGTLHRVDLAFSRDQAEKVYVQHRLIERGADVWAWLADGAVFYVCGDAKRMAVDVHEALIEIAMTHGGLDRDGALTYLKTLAGEHRYLKDVY